MNTIKTDCLIDTRDVSQLLGISYKSLANSRNTGTGIDIPFIKLGRLVRYRLSDVENYINQNRFNHAGQEANYEK